MCVCVCVSVCVCLCSTCIDLNEAEETIHTQSNTVVVVEKEMRE